MYKILFYNFNPRSVSNAHVGFRDLGYEIMEISCNDYNIEDSILEESLTKALDSFIPDIVFSYGWWQGRLNINLFCDIIKRKGIFHAFWAFDDPECFELISLPVGKKADIVFTTVIECIPKYKQYGINAELLLHGCYPPSHRRVNYNQSFKHDLVLLANNYNVKWNTNYFSYRYNGVKNIIMPLVENGYDIMTWGLWWDAGDRLYNLPKEKYGGTIPYGNEALIYSSSKIVLGLQTVGDSKSQFSVRTFESLACGAFHLCQYSPALEHFFEKGVHMEWTKSKEETIELVNFYLKNDDIRQKVALQGQELVYKSHTLLHRANQAIEIIRKYIRA